jgi:hypothetical protein
MANKKVSQLTSKPAVNLTDLFLIADPTSGQAFKTTISDLGTAIGSGVSSVNTLVGAVVLDTDDIQELVSPTNKWFTDTRARAAISAGTGISYNSGTGVITNAVTSGQIATALGYTPANGANYLALAGGTMGGAITGTIATFASSTSVTALGITLSGSTGDGVKITHSAGRAFNIQSSGSGFGILINNETASTSAPFTIQKQGLAVITLTDAGAGSFASSLTANSFIKTSGTSAQFLKADGSVDSSVYALDSAVVKLTGNQTIAGIKTFSDGTYHEYGLLLKHGTSTNAPGYTGIAGTSSGIKIGVGTPFHSNLVFSTSAIYTYTFPSVTGTLALTSDLSAYLPLSGGTLTGALSGTSATFASSLAFKNTNASQAGFVADYTGTGALKVSFSTYNNTFNIYDETNARSIISQNATTQAIAINGAATFSSSISAGGRYFASASVADNIVEVINTDTTNGYGLFVRAGGTAANRYVARFKNAADSDVMWIDKGGNVGIGTTTPNSTLHVAGTFRTALASGVGGDTLISAIVGVSNGYLINVDTSNNITHTWHTGTNTPSMRITSGGDVLIGTTSNLAGGSAMRANISADDFTLGVITASGASKQAVRFVNGTTAVGSITTTTTSTSYNMVSDYRLKEDLKSINGLEIVNKIKIYDYKWKSNDSRMDGVMAHELQEILPYAVTGTKDGTEMQSVDYSKIVPIMIQSIKELKAKIETLENK